MGAGYAASGSMSISDGVVVEHDILGFMGYEPGSTGLVTVDGPGSEWNGLLHTAGEFGDGTLNITNGGAVHSGLRGCIAYGPGSTGMATVDGPGSTWTTGSSFYVAWTGENAVLNITNGGAVQSSSSGFIGYDRGASGEVMVDGVGSMWTNNGYLRVGDRGAGSLTITGGGTVSNTDSIIGKEFYSMGHVAVDGVGSTWTNTGDLLVGQ